MSDKPAGLHKNAPAPATEERTKAVAFVNWALPMADGSLLKASKGFTIFQNPKFPNRHEDLLVDLAKKNGGMVELNLKCRVMINTSKDVGDVNLDDIVILPALPASA